MRGQVAHVPHTIVAPFNFGDGDGAQFYGQQQPPAGPPISTSKSRSGVGILGPPLLDRHTN